MHNLTITYFIFIDKEIWSKLSVSALPAEEKDKLYKAIDYNESVRVKYPTEVRNCIVIGFSVVTLPLNDKLCQDTNERKEVTTMKRQSVTRC